MTADSITERVKEQDIVHILLGILFFGSLFQLVCGCTIFYDPKRMYKLCREILLLRGRKSAQQTDLARKLF